ncbi:hypothetical protein ACFQ0B_80170 [Nonomuraea thailandensis]
MTVQASTPVARAIWSGPARSSARLARTRSSVSAGVPLRRSRSPSQPLVRNRRTRRCPH